MDGDISRQQGAEFCFLRSIIDRDVADAGLADLLGELCDISAGGEGDDFDFLRQFAGDLEGGAADRAGGA